MSSLFAPVSPSHLIYLTVSCILPACYLQTSENASPASGYDWSSFLGRIPLIPDPCCWPVSAAEAPTQSVCSPGQEKLSSSTTRRQPPPPAWPDPPLSWKQSASRIAQAFAPSQPLSRRHLLSWHPRPSQFTLAVPILLPSLANGCISVLEPV